jgi:hypothetical protein
VKNDDFKERVNRVRDAFLRKKATPSPSLSASPSVSWSASPSVSYSASVSPSDEIENKYEDFVEWCKEEYPQIVIEYDMIKGIKL